MSGLQGSSRNGRLAGIGILAAQRNGRATVTDLGNPARTGKNIGYRTTLQLSRLAFRQIDGITRQRTSVKRQHSRIGGASVQYGRTRYRHSVGCRFAVQIQRSAGKDYRTRAETGHMARLQSPVGNRRRARIGTGTRHGQRTGSGLDEITRGNDLRQGHCIAVGIQRQFLVGGDIQQTGDILVIARAVPHQRPLRRSRIRTAYRDFRRGLHHIKRRR